MFEQRIAPWRDKLRDAIVWAEAKAREHLVARRAAATPSAAKVYPIVDAHDHPAMLSRHTHFIGWLEAQRLEVEQRLAGRALGGGVQEDRV